MALTRRQILADRARALRRNMTPCEKRIWYDFLCSYEIPFCAQKVIGNYIVDFYSRRVHLSIEIDGESHFNERAVKHDTRRTIFLETLGIKEIRFTNFDIQESFDGVCEIIDKEVKARRNDLSNLSLERVRKKV